VDEHQNLPDINRLSVLAATILLAYAFTPFIKLPERSLAVQLPGFLFELTLNFNTLVSVFVAILAASGTSWLLQGHPQLGEQHTYQHWLLPALTAWAIGVPLGTSAVGLQWWAVFAFGGVLLVLVFTAEYIVVDVSDARQAPATVGLTAVSFALYLTLAIALRAAGLRLYLVLPALLVTIGLVALRTLYLRLGGRWSWSWSIAIALVVGQVVLGLHYWPISPLSFGLAVVGPAFALTSLAGSVQDGRPWRTLWVEPGLMLALFCGLAFIFR
jgi:hypothetical protein